MTVKRYLLILLSLSFVLGSTSPFAHADSREDEQWLTPDRYDTGFQGILISDVVNSHQLYSKLQVVTDDPAPGSMRLCKSMDEGFCKTASTYSYTAILPTCNALSTQDCISSLKAIDSSGKLSDAEYVSTVYPSHINKFKGSLKYLIPNPSEPSIWRIPGLPHLGGNLYAVVAGVQGGSYLATPRPYDNFNAFIIPVEKVSTGLPADDSVRDGFIYSYPECIDKKDISSDRILIGCRGMQDNGLGANKVKCALYVDNGTDCYVQRPFPTGARLQLNLILSAPLNGWLHGRMADPEIAITSTTNGNSLVQIEAAPIKVPIFYHGDKYVNLSQKLQDAYATASHLSAGGEYGRICCEYIADPLKRNSTSTPWSWGVDSMKEMSLWLDEAGNRSVAAPSTWSIHTLSGAVLNQNSKCSKTNSLNGIVTTNSTTYADGPPIFADGSLQYQVASPHYLSDGSVFLGNYNLLINAQVARCLYGFSNAPVSAKIEIFNDEGSQSVATTTFKENDGWMYLKASGFTFSQPTIKMTLKQNVQTLPVIVNPKSTIVCIKGNLKKKVISASPKCPTGYKAQKS